MIQFSVVIPNYNHSQFLKQRIDSILEQTHQHFELIILDDASTDNSISIIESYRYHPAVSHVIVNEKNSGSPFIQWTKGIGLAKYQWIWIAESDDYADHYYLEKMAEAIATYPAAGIVYSDSFIMDEQKTPTKFSERRNYIFSTDKWNSSYYNEGISETDKYLKFDCTINNASSAVFRKDIVLNEMAYLADFRYYGDWIFFIKLCLQSNIAYINAPLNFYRKHNRSALNKETSVLITKKEYFLILKYLYYNPLITDKKGLVDLFSFWYLNFGLLKDGPVKAFKILLNYFRTDRKLFSKVLGSIILIKLKRRKITDKL